MNKAIRIGVAILVLAGILFLARNNIAWAGNAPDVINRAGQSQDQSAGLEANANPGSVKPPPVVAPPITKPGTYPVGGVCTVYVEQLADTVSLFAKLLPFDVLKNKPQDTSRYLAGVCDLTYHVSGKPAPEIAPADGNVKICFAALPNIAGKIYVYDGRVWTALETVLESDNKLACAVAGKTGKYVLAAAQP
ncbi:MAG: hypothetical protein HYR93_11440 [Chloroflexi bacterium]|nr:hypothetical protein [Chloroflexota bacterium]MBI3340184.1 hypothetical protein [Chloroflexota bacterium]